MKYTWLPLNDYLMDRLQWWYKHRHFKRSPYVFVDYRPGHPHHGQPFTNRRRFMQGLCKRADVPPFGFHALRRFSASLLADKFKMSMPTIQKILRHANVSTTERYVQAIQEGQKEALKLLSDWAVQNSFTPNLHQDKQKRS